MNQVINTNLTLIVIVGIILLIMFVLLSLQFVMIRRLNDSFAKLGYVTREDAKKYFGDASEKVVEMNSSFYNQYQEMIDAGVRKVLSESGHVMAGSIAKAQQEAGQVLLKAQEDARHIVDSAKTDSQQYYHRALSESIDTIAWALERYVNDSLDVKKHEEIVMKLLEAYVNERRS